MTRKNIGTVLLLVGVLGCIVSCLLMVDLSSRILLALLLSLP